MPPLTNRLKCRYCDYTVLRFHGKKTGTNKLRHHVELAHSAEYMAVNGPAERLREPLPWNVPYYVSTYHYDGGYRWALHLCDDQERLTTVVRGLLTYEDREAAALGAQWYADECALGHGALIPLEEAL